MRAYHYPRAMSRSEFRVWAQRQDDRWEWINGLAFPAPLDFAGGAFEHARIASRLLGILANRLAPPCEAIAGDLILVESPTSDRFCDLFVVCEEIGAKATAVPVPVAIVEVTSPSSAHRDLFVKRDEYFEIRSLETYTVILPDSRSAMVFTPPDKDAVEQRTTIAIHGVNVALAELFGEVRAT